MTEAGSSPPLAQNDTNTAELFYDGALRRIQRLNFLLGIAGIPLVWIGCGPTAAAGFGLGAAVSSLNFYWLARAVQGLAGRIVERQSREKGGMIVLRFVLRYFLMGVAAYVIFTGWSGALRGLLSGLCLPVAAMMCEAVVEAYVALRRGI